MTQFPAPQSNAPVLIVIPTLNEAAHIAGVISGLTEFAARHPARIVVVDGGSQDGTQAIVTGIAATRSSVVLLHNPQRLQSAAINLAVQTFGQDSEWLIRMDAHAVYPPDYCDALLAEAAATGADSVVVGMRAVGRGFLQGVIARAQNARIGNGGAAHRMAGRGRFVDHGHHALMRLSAFRAVGGYDPRFSHNEDAELDHRLRGAGFRIWLTGQTRLDYLPRADLSALCRQYFRFGGGRAATMQKHGLAPGPRQAVVIALAPSVALAAIAPLWLPFAAPAALWGAACLAGGAALAVAPREDSALPGPQSGGPSEERADHPGDPAAGPLAGLLAGGVAGVMHLSWSLGFWSQVLGAFRPMRAPGQERQA